MAEQTLDKGEVAGSTPVSPIMIRYLKHVLHIGSKRGKIDPYATVSPGVFVDYKSFIRDRAIVLWFTKVLNSTVENSAMVGCYSIKNSTIGGDCNIFCNYISNSKISGGTRINSSIEMQNCDIKVFKNAIISVVPDKSLNFILSGVTLRGDALIQSHDDYFTLSLPSSSHDIITVHKDINCGTRINVRSYSFKLEDVANSNDGIFTPNDRKFLLSVIKERGFKMKLGDQKVKS